MTDYENALRLSQLEKAARECARGLSYKTSVSGYTRDSLSKNNRLRNEILSGEYKIGACLKFEITEPKQRTIYATKMRDRIWQKSMCNNGLRRDLLGSLIYDNGACQTDKGVDFAVNRAICFLQKFYREHGNNEGWYDHLDIKGYFPNTPCTETRKTVDRYVKDPDLRRHVYKIIDSFVDERTEQEIREDPFGKRGTALGSEISQLLQLALPNEIDHAIKEKLHVKYYIRFNDDMLVISDDKELLDKTRAYITSEYAKIGLEVTIKQKRAPLSDGVKFLKRRIILTKTGKVIIKADPKKFGEERRRLRKMKAKLDAGIIEMDRIEAHYQSVRAGLSRCDERVRVRSLDHFYEELFGKDAPRQKRGKKNAYRKGKPKHGTPERAAGKAAGGEQEAGGNH